MEILGLTPSCKVDSVRKWLQTDSSRSMKECGKFNIEWNFSGKADVFPKSSRSVVLMVVILGSYNSRQIM